ncbi:MAG: U32 family peptidase [Saccharofermentans sp.]|nr:U32 family peptidase [Saccharofermentans sp.]
MERIELLAPAGNLTILKAAIDSGADAVYCGLTVFNARINAENLTLGQFEEGVDYAHARSSKVYLTVNTLVSDGEREDLFEVVSKACEAGADGLIVQDIAVLKMLREAFPDVRINASTQMNIYSRDQFKELSRLGVNRVVLPRELSMDEISSRVHLAARYGIDCEVFAHGAVCVCASGLCLFSAMNKGGTRSGNRGTCAQPCREEYKLYNNGLRLRTGHLLSPKDRDVSDYISRLIESGVASLKLEGRMRDENYVRSAVRSYRTLIDAYYYGILDDTLVREVKRDLLINFNRGGSYTSQYLSGRKDDNLLSGEYPGKYGYSLGKISRLDVKKGTVTVSLGKHPVIPSKGDYLSVRNDKAEICSFPVGKIHEMPHEIAVKGLHPDAIQKLKPGLNVFIMNHTTEQEKSELRRTPVRFNLYFNDADVTLETSVISGPNSDMTAAATSAKPVGFEGAALDEDRIRQQLAKTLDTAFYPDEINIYGETRSCPISLINGLRREVLASLEDDIKGSYKRTARPVSDEEPSVEFTKSDKSKLTMYTYPVIRLNKDIVTEGADIYCYSIYDMAVKELRDYVISFAEKTDTKIAVFLPDFSHDLLEKVIEKVLSSLKADAKDRLYCVISARLFSDKAFLKGLGVKDYISAGANIFSSKSAEIALGYCDGLFMSHESGGDELVNNALDVFPAGKTLLVQNSGMIPWMQSDFCVCGQNKKHCDTCAKVSCFELEQKDRGAARLLAVPHSIDCSCTLYGPAKNLIEDDLISTLSYGNFDLIVNHTIMPEVKDAEAFD